MKYDQPLIHWGIPGMKWGVRRDHKKLDAVLKNKSLKDTTDLERFKHLKDPLAVRVGKEAASMVKQIAIMEALNFALLGKTSRNYSKMSKQDAAKLALSLSTKIASNLVIKDVLAKSALKKYTDTGRRKKIGALRDSREDIYDLAIRVITPVASLGLRLAGLKLNSVIAEHKANEERFNSWGQNILSEKVDNIVWQSDDLKTAVIDNR